MRKLPFNIFFSIYCPFLNTHCLFKYNSDLGWVIFHYLQGYS